MPRAQPPPSAVPSSETGPAPVDSASPATWQHGPSVTLALSGFCETSEDVVGTG